MCQYVKDAVRPSWYVFSSLLVRILVPTVSTGGLAPYSPAGLPCLGPWGLGLPMLALMCCLAPHGRLLKCSCRC